MRATSRPRGDVLRDILTLACQDRSIWAGNGFYQPKGPMIRAAYKMSRPEHIISDARLQELAAINDRDAIERLAVAMEQFEARVAGPLRTFDPQ